MTEATGLQAPPRDTILLGVTLTTTAYALFVTQDAGIKLLVATLSVWQVLFFRSLAVTAGCLAFGGPDLFRRARRSPIFAAMLGRSLVILAAWFCFYTAARELQLAELMTIYFAAPVMIIVLAIPMLGERVPASRWAAVLVGFAGVFVACDPGGIGFTWPVLLTLLAAFLWALANVLLRKTAMEETTGVQMALNNGFFLILSLPVLPFVWRLPASGDFLLLLAVGALGGVAQLIFFEGMRRAPISVIAPFEYTSLVFSFALGFLIWGDVPRLEVFVGAALILAAGGIALAGERYARGSDEA